MNLNIFDKIINIFKYNFSSFMGIELFLIMLLFFLLLLLNLHKKNKIANFFSITILSLFFLSLIIFNVDYLIYSFDYILKIIIKYIYFPSTVFYFLFVFIIFFNLIYTILSSKLTNFKKVFNYINFFFINLLFVNFVSYVLKFNLDISNRAVLYENDYILSFVNISNFIFIFYVLYTLFYYLYLYFKRKYDKEEII